MTTTYDVTHDVFLAEARMNSAADMIERKLDVLAQIAADVENDRSGFVCIESRMGGVITNLRREVELLRKGGAC